MTDNNNIYKEIESDKQDFKTNNKQKIIENQTDADINKEINSSKNSINDLEDKILKIENKLKLTENKFKEFQDEMSATRTIITVIFAVITLFVGILWHIIWVKSVFTWNDQKNFSYNAEAYAFIIIIPIGFVLLMILFHWTLIKRLPWKWSHHSNKKDNN